MNGGGAKVCPGGGATGGGTAAGVHALGMNGGGPGGAGAGGICGRPTTAVDQVPTHRSARVWARGADVAAPTTSARTLATPRPDRNECE